ncbi:MAG: carboxypeptidase-like regulatory domain-containing protein [Gemmataceae bacterium]
MKLRPGLALLFCLLIGCSRAPVSPSPSDADKDKPSAVLAVPKPKPTPEKKHDAPVKDIAKPRDNPEIVRNNERGILRGVVRWEGTEPKPPTPRLRIDAATHGVAQTVVWLTPSDKKMKPVFPMKTVKLSAEQSAYRPHIVLARKGDTIELRTIEDRADFQATGAASFSETIQRGNWRTFPLSSLGLIEVRSQLQPQRIPAYVWVLDSVFATLSEKDGQFRLPPMPAGEYELVLWHEGWRSNEAKPRTARVRLTLGANDGAEVRWTLREQK